MLDTASPDVLRVSGGKSADRSRSTPAPPSHLRFHFPLRLSAGPLLICGVCAIVGCGGSDAPDSVDVGGTVTYNDKPLTTGEVVYTPAEGEEEARPARGRIQEDGSFDMSTSVSVPGVIPGKYDVSIVIPGEGPQALKGPTADPIERPVDNGRGSSKKKPIIPERYLRAETSGLEDVVDENHPGTFDLKLTD